MKIKHRLNDEKTLEALVFVASKWPGITPFFVSKILYFAEKSHINKFGRPITADLYIAMDHGPVPSRIRDYIEGNYLFYDNADQIPDAISVSRPNKYNEVRALREPKREVFSKSDIDCLNEAIVFCRDKEFPELKAITHTHKTYKQTELNDPIDYELFIDDDNPHRNAIIAEAIGFSAFSV